MRSVSPARAEAAVAIRAWTDAADTMAGMLRFALAAWLGAVAFFSVVVAPAAFRVLPSRALAGALAGEALPVLFLTGILIGAGVLAYLAVGWRTAAPRSRRFATAAAMAMVASLFTAQFVIGARIAGLRARMGGTLDQLPEGDPLRQHFGLLHGYSVLALGVGAAAAMALCILLRARRTTR